MTLEQAVESLLDAWHSAFELNPITSLTIQLHEVEKAFYRTHKPQMFCQECQRAFRPESAHPRKYCSYTCAHRATDRAWHKRKRAAETG